MVDFRTVVTVVLIGTLIFGVTGEKYKRLYVRKTRDQDSQNPCKTNDNKDSSEHPCENSSENPKPINNSPNENTDAATDSLTTSNNANWCQLSNGTFLFRGQTFMKTRCVMCQCTSSRFIRCAILDCLPAYCIDNKMPIQKAGQCCAQCDYEPISKPCVYKNISYLHGAVIKSVGNKIQCWCQLGNIECRNYIGSFQNFDFLYNGATIYIVVIVIISVFLLGLLLCCGCTFSVYHYFLKNQPDFQQAFDQYFNQGGWQPMNEEEVVIDNGAEEKQAEAESYQNENEYVHDESVPPPYNIENISSVPDEKQK